MTVSDILKLTRFILKTDSRKVWTYLQRFILGGTVLILLAAVTLYSGGSMTGSVFFTFYLYLLTVTATLGTLSIFSSFLSYEINAGMIDLLVVTGLNPLKFLTGCLFAKFHLLVNLLILQIPFCFFCITLGGISINHLISSFVLIVSWLLFTSGICLLNTVFFKNKMAAMKLSVLILILLMGFSPVGPLERINDLQAMRLASVYIFPDTWIYLLVFIVLFVWGSTRFGRPATGEDGLIRKIQFPMLFYLFFAAIVWKLHLASDKIQLFDIIQYLLIPLFVSVSFFKRAPAEGVKEIPKERIKRSSTGTEALREKDQIHIPDGNGKLFPFIHVLHYIISFIVLLLTLITGEYAFVFAGAILLACGLVFQHIACWARLIKLIDTEMKDRTIEALILLPLNSGDLIKCKMKEALVLKGATAVSYSILCFFVLTTPTFGVMFKLAIITLPLLKFLLDYMVVYIAFKVREAPKTAAFTMIFFLLFLHFIFPVFMFPVYIAGAFVTVKLLANDMYLRTLYQ